jgi:predicted short-subunit dehydrogenase-like oxidoreductase (DUF2520 family)
MTFDFSQDSIAFIGTGRLATGLALALHANGMKIGAVAGRNPVSATALATRIAGCEVLPVQTLAERHKLVFIAVPDDAIASVAQGITWRAGQAVVHCSGATEISVLEAAAQAGALIGGFHPLQTFTDPQVALRTLPGCTVAIEAAEPLFATLATIARAIGCHPFALPAGARARYHATGSYAAQFINALLLEASAVWESFGMDRRAAVQALLPLLKGTVAAIEHDGLARGLAGPVSRGDAGTVRRQLEGIAGLGEERLLLFRELTRRTLPLAIERGTLNESQVAALRALLRSPASPARDDT